MADSVYKVIELVGTSTESWEKAAAAAIALASKSLRELRVAEVIEGEFVPLAYRVGPVRVDHDPVHVARHQEGRIFQREGILL